MQRYGLVNLLLDTCLFPFQEASGRPSRDAFNAKSEHVCFIKRETFACLVMQERQRHCLPVEGSGQHVGR